MKIINWIIGSKIKTYLSLGVVVVIGGYVAFHLVNYKNAIRDSERFKIERDKIIVENTEFKAYNATLLAQKETLGKIIATDSINYFKTIRETQLIINQQRLLVKEKEVLIDKLSKGLKCKVPQKVKVGFLKYETRMVIVDCDSLQKTLE